MASTRESAITSTRQEAPTLPLCSPSEGTLASAHLQDQGAAGVRPKLRPAKVPAFLSRLHTICETIEPEKGSWSDDGKSFIVKSSGFADTLQLNFKSSLQTFIRQLHHYKFHRAERGSTWSFSHESFVRSRPDLLVNIHRGSRGRQDALPTLPAEHSKAVCGDGDAVPKVEENNPKSLATLENRLDTLAAEVRGLGELMRNFINASSLRVPSTSSIVEHGSGAGAAEAVPEVPSCCKPPTSKSESAAPRGDDQEDETWLAGISGEGNDDEWMWNLEMGIFGTDQESSEDAKSTAAKSVVLPLDLHNKGYATQSPSVASSAISAKRPRLSSDGRIRVVCRCRNANPGSQNAVPPNEVLVRAFHQIYDAMMDRAGASSLSSLRRGESFQLGDSDDQALLDSAKHHTECDCAGGCEDGSCCHNSTTA